MIFEDSKILQFTFRPVSVSLREQVETLVPFECVPTYSTTLKAQFITMDGTKIIGQTPLKSGMSLIP